MSIGKVALLGYGQIGHLHQNAILSSNNLELVAIIDSQNQDSNFPYFTDLDSFFEAKIPADLISIATPNGLHFEQAKIGLLKGYNVLVEKPICLNSSDLKELLALENQQNVRLFNMLQLRMAPIVQWVKDLIENQSLGQIYMVNTQCYWNRNQAYYQLKDWHGSKQLDGGVLFTQFSHFVDILHFWFKELQVTDSQSFNFNHKESIEFADSGYVQFKTQENTQGSLIYTISTFDQNFDSTITILAEKGTIQIGGQYMNEIRYCHLEKIENPFNEPAPKQFHQLALEECFQAITKQRESVLDAKNAQKVIEFLEKVS